MPRVKMAVARERRARVLALLVERGALEGEARLSITAISHAAGLTESQARSVIRSLKKAGLVASRPRLMPNGGTAENAYRLTSLGARVLSEPGEAEEAACQGVQGREG